LKADGFYFITHPNVVISRDIPVPRWPLSDLGRQRMRAGLQQPWIQEVTSIYCSTEQKAIDGAAILADHLSLGFERIPELGENDRSATGFLPPRGVRAGGGRILQVARSFGARLGARRRCPVPHRSRRGADRRAGSIRGRDRDRLARGGRHVALLSSRRHADCAALGPAAQRRRQFLPIHPLAAPGFFLVAAY
jgi:hypothetical protein